MTYRKNLRQQIHVDTEPPVRDVISCPMTLLNPNRTRIGIPKAGSRLLRFEHIRVAVLGLLLVVLTQTACRDREATRNSELSVFAAASTVDAIERIGQIYSDRSEISVRVAGGPSGVLSQQISSGACCDVFVAAHPRYTERLKNHDNAGTLLDLVGNELVWVMPADRKNEIALTQQIDGAKRISIANPDHAPAGRYARAALQAGEQWPRLQERLVYANDARMAAQYVADGLVDLGVIYRSDATAFRDRIHIIEAVALPKIETIRYQGLAFRCNSDGAAAEAFLRFLASPEVADIWQRAGFRSSAASIPQDTNPTASSRKTPQQ